MNIVQQKIKCGRIAEALQELTDRSCSEGLLLSSRLNRLEKNNRLGILSTTDYNLEMSRITVAALEYAENIFGKSTIPISNPISPVSNTLSIETKLLTIISTNKRRRPAIAEEGTALLAEVRDYSDTKKIHPTFDISERRLKVLIDSINLFIHNTEEAKADDLESIVAKVMEYLKEPIPSWENLNLAHNLCVGRGFNTTEGIKTALSTTPEDNGAIISIAEKLELFISNITIK